MLINKFRQQLSVFILLFTGVIFSLLIFFEVYKKEVVIRKEKFDTLAGDRAEVIVYGFGNDLEVLSSIGYFYAGSVSVERAEFKAFTKGILEVHPEILELRWMPRVKGGERASLEEAASREGLSRFHIKDVDGNGNLSIADEREYYFPVYFREPDKKYAVDMLGLDSSHIPERWDAMKRARDSGRPAITAELNVIGEPEVKSASRVYLPIYTNDASRNTLDERRKNLKGFVVMLFNTERLMDVLLKNSRGKGIDTYLYNESLPEGSKFISFDYSRTRGEKIPPIFGEGQLRLRKGFSWKGIFRVADADWTIICRPAPFFLKHNRIIRPWFVLGACLLLTVVLAEYFRVLMIQRTHIEKLVGQRTEELKRANEEWEKTFNSISEYIFILNLKSEIIKANQAFLDSMRLTQEEVIGKKCFEIVHGRYSSWPGCPYEETMKERKTYTVEVEDPHLGVSLLVTTSPIFDSRGEVAGVVHIAKDITDIKQAQKRMEENAEIKSRFTSLVSHELRTPLGPIAEGANLMIEGSTGPITEGQRDLLDVIRRNADRLARLINDVLDFQKLESGYMPFDIKENDISKAAREVCDTMALSAKEKGLDLRLELEEGIPSVRFDYDKIVQVLSNLVNNAVKFTDKGSVTIRAKRDSNAVRVLVYDTGPGIHKKDIDKLFQAFQQVGPPKNRKPGSTGLGLVICREIIARHMGKLWVESEPGKGSTFQFLLPIAERRG